MEVKIVDTHNDYLTKGVNENYLEEREQFLSVLCSPVWTTEIANPIEKIKKSKEFLCSKNLSTALKLCIEDCWFINENNLDEILKLKPFYAGLTWNKTNSLAGGCFDIGGITRFGEFVIREFENKGIIVDTAHQNRQTFFEFAKITTKPLFNSHSAVDFLCPTSRNLNDEQLKIFRDTKGFIGVYFVSEFLNRGEVTSKTVAEHIDYIVSKCGIDCVGFGTDFNGTDDLPEDVQDYQDVENVLMNLKARGYDDISLNKIRYNNFYNYLTKI